MPKKKTSELVCQGEKRLIEYAVRPDGSIPAQEYYDSLEIKERAKFFYLFKKMADKGRIHNKQQFNSLGDSMYEFKAYDHRILCFWEGSLILTHGFRKQSPRTPRTELELSKTIRAEYKEGRKRGG